MAKLKQLIFFFLFFSLAEVSFSQISIIGPTCVTPGLTYRYSLSGNWEAGSSVQVCLLGGVIAETTNTCVADTSLSSIKVIWSDIATMATITVASSTEEESQTISIAPLLIGGVIDSSIKEQLIEYETQPANIICSEPTGGSCEPSYVYQWQQSLDNVNWTDLDGNSTDQNFAFPFPLTQQTFFRRKTQETTSGIIAYSTVAVVYVQPRDLQNKKIL